MSDKCSVLVADDNRDAAVALVVLLRALGHPALAAYDGARPMKLSSTSGPTSRSSISRCPPWMGAWRRRGSAPTSFLPKIIASLTGMPHDQEPMRSLAGVFDGHLRKPCEMQELEDLLERGQRAWEGGGAQAPLNQIHVQSLPRDT